MNESLHPGMGTKRTCRDCGAKFYDLARVPAVCPKCHAPFVEPVRAAAAPRSAMRGRIGSPWSRGANLPAVASPAADHAEPAEEVDDDEEEAEEGDDALEEEADEDEDAEGE